MTVLLCVQTAVVNVLSRPHARPQRRWLGRTRKCSTYSNCIRVHTLSHASVTSWNVATWWSSCAFPRAAVANYCVQKGQAFRTKLIYFENDREFPGENREQNRTKRYHSLFVLKRAQACVLFPALPLCPQYSKRFPTRNQKNDWACLAFLCVRPELTLPYITLSCLVLSSILILV